MINKNRNTYIPEYSLGGNILSGAASGAAAGTAVMPGWGTFGGAVLGAFSGLLSGQQEQEQQEEQKRQQRNQVIAQQRLGDYKADPYYLPMGAFGMEAGMPNAEIEGNESLKFPNGEDMVAQGPSHEQGGMPTNLPSHTKVYSDRLTIPGTNITFADKHKELMAKKAKEEKKFDGGTRHMTRLQERTIQRNISNYDKQMDELFQLQQSINGEAGQGQMQAAQGLQPPMQGNTPQMPQEGLEGPQMAPQGIPPAGGLPMGAYGLEVPQYGGGGSTPGDPPVVPYNKLPANIQDIVPQLYGYAVSITQPELEYLQQALNSGVQDINELKQGMKQAWATSFKGNPAESNEGGFDAKAIAHKLVQGKYGGLDSIGLSNFSDDTLPKESTTAFKPNPEREVPDLGVQTKGVSSIDLQPSKTQLQPNPKKLAKSSLPTENPVNGNGGNTWEAVAALAPALWNIGEGLFGKPESIKPTYNYAGLKAAAKMKDRGYDIDPMLQANETAYYTALRNMQQGSTGQQLAIINALLTGKSKSDATAYATKQNYEMDQFNKGNQLLTQTGAQNARLSYMTEDWNARARGAKKNMFSTGISQASQVGQLAQLDNNQRNADKTRLGIYEKIFPFYSTDQYGNLSLNQEWLKNNMSFYNKFGK